MWSRKRGQVRGFVVPKGLEDFVPEGLDDRSQAIYCLECFQKRDPSRRDGASRAHEIFTAQGRKRSLSTQSHRSLRDGSNFHLFQAMNRLATIIQSLRRDNKPAVLSTLSTPHLLVWAIEML
jgi:hypothetical protein